MPISTIGSAGLTTPLPASNLGTPSGIILTNATAVPASQITGSRAIPVSTVPAGSVIQVVQYESTPAASATTSTSFVTSNLIDVPITPVAANSKILISIENYIMHVNGDADNWGGGTMIYRAIAGGSYAAVASTSNPLDGMYINAQPTGAWKDCVGKSIFLDTPSYTLGQTINYQLWFRKSSRGSGGWYVHHTGGLATYVGTTRVLGRAQEIAA